MLEEIKYVNKYSLIHGTCALHNKVNICDLLIRL